MPRKTLEERRAYRADYEARGGSFVRRAWQDANRQHLRDMSREYHRTHKKEDSDYARLYVLGITPEQFEAKLSEQNYLCGLCGLPFGENTTRDAPRADHNHETGEFRGVLHRHCNLGIGTFYEDVDLLAKAIVYLQKFKGDIDVKI